MGHPVWHMKGEKIFMQNYVGTLTQFSPRKRLNGDVCLFAKNFFFMNFCSRRQIEF